MAFPQPFGTKSARTGTIMVGEEDGYVFLYDEGTLLLSLPKSKLKDAIASLEAIARDD